MKAILKRKESNVTANQCLGSYSGYGIREELFQKENGEFFLVGKGGPSTKYAVHCCGNLIAGSKMAVLSEGEAQEWGRERLSEEEYSMIFSRDNTSGGGERI